MGHTRGHGVRGRADVACATSLVRALLSMIAAVASFAILTVTPAGASGVSSGASVVDSSHTYAGVVAVGTDAWAYAPAGCAGNASDSFLYEFSEYGVHVASVDLGPGLCDLSQPIVTNGSYAAVANGNSVELVDLSTLVVTTVGGTLPLRGFGPVNLVLTNSVLVVSVGFFWMGSYSLAGTPVQPPFPEFLPETDASASDGTFLYQVGTGTIASWELSLLFIFPYAIAPFPSTAPGSSLVVDGTSGYVSTATDGTIYRVDLSTLSTTGQTTIPGAGDLTAMTQSGADLWVADGRVDTLWEVDPTTFAVVREVSLSSTVTSISGDGTVVFAVEASGALIELNQPALFIPSTTTLTAPSGSPTIGSPETLSASVSTPGTVTFSDGGVAVAGCIALPATTSATCTWTPSGVGAQQITAALVPSNGAYLASTSAPLSIVVNPAVSSVAASVTSFHVSTGVATAPFGTIALGATASTPGTVTFSVAGSLLPGCVGVPDPTSNAACAYHPNAPGTYTITASLAPYSANYQVSSATLTVRVVPVQIALTVAPFAPGSAVLATTARRATEALAQAIVRDGYRHVTLVGTGDGPGDAVLGGRRAAAVGSVLAHDLAGLGAAGVDVTSHGSGRGPGARVRATAAF